MGSLGGHDLDVLECAVCCSVVSIAAGNAGAMTHHDRRGGQLCQTLVHAVNCRLVWKIQTRRSFRWNRNPFANMENRKQNNLNAKSKE